MDKAKCPTCGTENPTDRQICHFCGQLLSSSGESENADSLELVREELKRAAEAATTPKSRASHTATRETQKRSSDGARESGGSSKITVLSQAGEERRAPSKRRDTRRSQREKIIVVAALLVTIIALGFLGARYFLSGRESRPTLPVAPGSIDMSGRGGEVYPDSEEVFVREIPREFSIEDMMLPTLNDEEDAEQTTEESAIPEPDFEAIADGAASRASGTLDSLIDRIGGELGLDLAVGRENYHGMVTQKGVDTIVVTISFHGGSFSGSTNVLVRRTGENWNITWQVSHYRDFNLNFRPAAVIATADGGEETIAGVQLGSGGFRPLDSILQEPIRIIYG